MFSRALRENSTLFQQQSTLHSTPATKQLQALHGPLHSTPATKQPFCFAKLSTLHAATKQSPAQQGSLHSTPAPIQLLCSARLSTLHACHNTAPSSARPSTLHAYF